MEKTLLYKSIRKVYNSNENNLQFKRPYKAATFKLKNVSYSFHLNSKTLLASGATYFVDNVSKLRVRNN